MKGSNIFLTYFASWSILKKMRKKGANTVKWDKTNEKARKA